MYEDDKWNPVTGEELTGFLEQVGKIDGVLDPSAETTKVEWRSLPFFDSVAMIRMRDENWMPKELTVYYLTDQGTLYRLNGTSPPIHDINAKAPIKVNDGNVLDYLRFFCFFVRGEEGPFLIAEDMDEPNMPEMDDKMKAVIGGSLRPASFEGKNEQSHWLCDAVVFYSNALFIANFSVHPSGMIEMLDDEPIASDLSVRVNRPVALDTEGKAK
ncbi:MAG: hypothetical protein JKY11_05790 [Alphaproteobacteria bacterium]|nr:hypothetical protein [Alphaproteobacteria bacterium]